MLDPRPCAHPAHLRRGTASLAVLLTLAGCSSGSDDDGAQAAATSDATGSAEPSATASDAAATGGDFPVTISSEAGEFTLDDAPERIVSLSPSATEILFAVGAGDQVVAVDEFSTFPEDAPVTDLSGFQPNVEAVVAYDPDLVVISNDANDLVASLTELDVPVLANPAPADLEAGYEGMAEIGVATGRVDQTAAEIERIRREVDAAVEQAPETAVRVYHELDDTYFAASRYGFIGSIYNRLGATTIADEADTDRTGFPQLTEEAVIAADPELVVITDQVDYGPEDVAARPGWQDVTAVREGDVVVVDADVASRWGPRIPQFVETAAAALDRAASVDAG